MAGLPIIGVDVPDPVVSQTSKTPKPPWLRVQAPGAGKTSELRALLAERRLHTVCSSAACPNMGDCWSAGTATFMILGNECTRACRFCDIKTSLRPNPVDLEQVEWCELIVLMENRYRKPLLDRVGSKAVRDKRIVSLDIADDYEAMDETLIALLRERFERFVR